MCYLTTCHLVRQLVKSQETNWLPGVAWRATGGFLSCHWEEVGSGSGWGPEVTVSSRTRDLCLPPSPAVILATYSTGLGSHLKFFQESDGSVGSENRVLAMGPGTAWSLTQRKVSLSSGHAKPAMGPQAAVKDLYPRSDHGNF